MKYSNILKIINEHAPSGSTCASNVAVVSNPLGSKVIKRSLGVGFNPDGDHGVYEPFRNKDENKK